LICQASGILTRAARVRIAAKDKHLLSFGTRRVHPALAPTVERCCYTGGFDGVSNELGAELINLEPEGTMPHALILVVGDSKKAFQYYDEVMPPEVKRIALVDTNGSIKQETHWALEAMGKNLYGIRIDRDDLKRRGREMRWELDRMGRPDVKLYCSGGLDANSVARLSKIYDGFGVGTDISNAPTMDFAKKIIKVNDEDRAKVGNLPGQKCVLRKDNYQDTVYLIKNPEEAYEIQAKEGGELLLKKWMEASKIVKRSDPETEIRKRNFKKLYSLPYDLKSLTRIENDRVSFVAYR